MACLVNPGVGEDGAGTRLRVIAAVLGKHALEFSRPHIVRVAGVGVGVDAVALGHGFPQLDVPLHHHVEHPLILVAELVLIELAQPHSGLQHDVAGARIEVAAQHFHQRGLTAAVRADQPVAVAVGEFDGDLFKQRFCAELDGDVGSSKHLYQSPYKGGQPGRESC